MILDLTRDDPLWQLWQRAYDEVTREREEAPALDWINATTSADED